MKKKTTYLPEHPRATLKVAKREINENIEKLKIDKWAKVSSKGRSLSVKIDDVE